MVQTFYLYDGWLYRHDELDGPCQLMGDHWMPIRDSSPIRRGVAITDYEAERALVEAASLTGAFKVDDSAQNQLRLSVE